MPKLPEKITRWTAVRKMAVLDMLYSSVLSADDLHERYNISAQELQEWQRWHECYGARHKKT